MGLEPGQDLLHYRVIETLGAGGMGVVNGDFLLLQRVPGSGIQTRLHLVQNWFQELERLVP